jgi:diguanylate cyclase (GGDEF)-like protein
MAIKSLHQHLLTRFHDRLTPDSFSLPTLETAIRCLFQMEKESQRASYLLVHLPTSLYKSLTDLPLIAGHHTLQWYRLNNSEAIIETEENLHQITIKSSDPFAKDCLLFRWSQGIPTLFLAREKAPSNVLFRSQPIVYSVIWTSDKEIIAEAWSFLQIYFPQWVKQYKERLKISKSSFSNDVNTSILSSLRNLELECRPLIYEQWKSEVIQRFQQIAWGTNPESIIKHVARAFKEHTGYDHFELNVKHYPGLPSSQDGAFSIRDSRMGGELLSIILHPDRSARILRSRNPIFIPDVSDFPAFMNPGLLSIMNIRSGILAPLWAGSDDLGLIKIFFHRRLDMFSEEKKLLELICEFIARSLNNTLRFYLTERRATIDGLTNVFNQRFFSDQLSKEFNRARRYKNALALIMIDINHFKLYNDTNGHPAGNRVLAKVAQLIQGAVREIDLVARYGGDEFALILPENDARQGLIVAEKVRKVIEEYPFDNEESLPNGKLTISLGISDNSHAVKSADEMIEIADQALYWVKRHGGNRSKIGNHGVKS